MAGICGKNIRSQVHNTAYHSPYYIGYNLSDGNLYANKKNIVGTDVIAVTGESIFKVEVNMNLGHLTWSLNDSPFYLAKIPKEMSDVYIVPFVAMLTAEDTIEFINK
jgi:hypothetical protein